MNLNKKYLLLTALPVAGLGIFSVIQQVDAQGFGRWFSTQTPVEQATQLTQRFTEQAQMLGISVDEYKNLWSQGKSFQQIAQEKGINRDQLRQAMQQQKTGQMKTYLQNLVSQGVITQAQADARLKAMEARILNKLNQNQRHGQMEKWGQ